MKNLNTITIGNINLLQALKAFTIIVLSAYLVSVFTVGFFSLISFALFNLLAGLFLICTHKPKLSEREILEKRIEKRLFEINLKNN